MMTIRNQGSATELNCDRCEDGLMINFHSPSQNTTAKRNVVLRAESAGWLVQSTVNGGPDLCPDCLKELKGITT